ncbi:hypothetical protein CAPTEDRAFT_199780 [Capitella teleta]|uniref:Endonuclease/exonuclease/phosphatase domain-containing protein n=1 Tax=Capitella teleta TaxID=283909 RepID=R7V082_CAPTE|nr:hypothetical protein CAPTEDRAFT_199780 [Capitella teleta]|eukprot:ELU12238.1 hypothetical protein CAPTEDRAFT_199780 [Capitella teleta]
MLTRSKSMSDTKISITKEELDEAIQKALKVVADLYERKLAVMQQRLHQQEETTSQLKEEVNRLEQILQKIPLEDQRPQTRAWPELQRSSIIIHLPKLEEERWNQHKKKSSYSIATLNCQSIKAKHSQIEILIDSLNANSFEVLSLQETWLEHGVDAKLLQMPNYDLVWRGASTSRHGGVGFYIKNTLKYSILLQSHNSNIWESMFIRIESNLLPQPIIIGSIYRPPSQLQADKITFIEELSQILNTLQHHSHLPIILTGDFNFDLLKLHHNDTITQFYNSITSLGFDPQITLPTRTTDTSHTLIDNIFTNSFTTSSPISGILTSPISDHQLCFIRFNVKNLNLNNKYITIKNRPHNLHELIKTDLQNMNIMQQMDHNPDTDPSHNYTIIHNAISSTIDKHTTTKTVKFNKHKHKKSEWITQGLIRSIRYRDKLHLKMKRTHPDSPQRNTLKTNIATYNKILKKTIRQAKALHYNNIFTQAHNNPKDTWKAINNTLNRNTKTDTNIEYLIDNDRKITAPKEIAEHLNTFFTNIGHKIASQIPPSDTTIDAYLQPINAPPFDFHPITQTDIDQTMRDCYTPKRQYLLPNAVHPNLCSQKKKQSPPWKEQKGQRKELQNAPDWRRQEQEPAIVTTAEEICQTEESVLQRNPEQVSLYDFVKDPKALQFYTGISNVDTELL